MKTPTYQSMPSGTTPPSRSLCGSSPKLHTKSATFSPKLHSYFRTQPRPDRGFAPWHIKALRSSARFTETERSRAAFTLIELMAATTVLSIILLMMVGMQDQMSKAWSNSNRRTDATREARAAARLMASDLGGMAFRPNTPNSSYDSFATVLTNQGLPYLYSSNGAGTSITIPDAETNSAYLFALCNQASRGTNYTDIGLVGYYIASRLTTNVNGFVTTNYNLHRYYVPASNAVGNLASWLTSKDAANLFSGVNPATDDILARNTCNLRITFFGKPVLNGLNYSNAPDSKNTSYRGNKVQVEWTTYPEDFAQKLPLSSWTSPGNIQKYGRTYEFRLDLRRN